MHPTNSRSPFHSRFGLGMGPPDSVNPATFPDQRNRPRPRQCKRGPVPDEARSNWPSRWTLYRLFFVDTYSVAFGPRSMSTITLVRSRRRSSSARTKRQPILGSASNKPMNSRPPAPSHCTFAHARRTARPTSFFGSPRLWNRIADVMSKDHTGQHRPRGFIEDKTRSNDHRSSPITTVDSVSGRKPTGLYSSS